MRIEAIPGVPRFEVQEFAAKSSKYCVLIPIINEHGRIELELERAFKYGIPQQACLLYTSEAETVPWTIR